MDKKLLIPAILITALTVMVICVDIIENPSPPLSSAPAPEKKLHGRTVTVMSNHPHARAADVLAEWFHEESGAVVRNIVVDYAQMRSYVLDDFHSANPQLDIIMLWYVDMGALAEQGVLADLTDFIAENRNILQPDDFIPSLYDPFSLYKGKRLALPYDGDTHVLFYRKSLLEKHGFPPPQTWEDYTQIIRTITEKERQKGIFGTAIMAPPGAMAAVPFFMNRLTAFGGKMLDETGRPCINSEEAVAALGALAEHAEYALPTPLETDWEVARDAFLSGKIALAEQWTDIGIMAEDPGQSLIRGDWGVVQIPAGSGEKGCHAPSLNAGYSLALSTKASDPETARAYLLFVSRPDITLRLNLINGGIDPVRISVLQSEEYQKFAPELSRAARAALESAGAWPRVPRAQEMLDILTRNIRITLEGNKSPREALDDTQEKWLTITASESS